jgi:hypothetical protein
MEVRRCCTATGVDGGATVTPDDDGVVDGDRLDEGKTKEWSTTSIVAWSVEETRPEGAWASVRWRQVLVHRFAAK